MDGNGVIPHDEDMHTEHFELVGDETGKYLSILMAVT